jgi:1,4-dihydroxy-2-naphthoate octaprenyltransferase
MNALARAFAVVRLGRPVFLLGGFALYGLGALAALRRGHSFDGVAFALGQLAVTAIQLMTHYANDYYDYEADKANQTPTRWSGGSRVLVQGELAPAVALRAAVVVGAVAPLSAAALLVHSPRELGAVVLLASMQALAWSHAGPPLRLHSRGLGEPLTALVVPLLTPLAGFLIQAGRFELFPLVLSAPLVFLQLAMLVTIEFPDHEGDRSVGKVSWVVLLGPDRAARVVQACLVTALVLAALAARLDASPWRSTWLCAALVVLGTLHCFRLQRGDHRRNTAWESLAFTSVALFFLTTVVELTGLAWSLLAGKS